VLYAACIDKGGSIFQKAAAAVSYALFLFFAFKEGFVRHDAHAMVAGTAVVLAVLSSILALRTKPLVLAANALFAVVVCGYIDSHYVKFSLGRIVTNTLDSYRDAFDGLASRLSGGSGFESQFRESLASIKKEASMPALQGTTDIYSFNQSVLFANGQTWSPRPVFQSYAAFTTDLMRLNADHLLGANAPQNIVFRVEPIDDRLPALEDGLSWPVLIQNYAISGADNFFLYLKKRVTPAADHALPEIYSGRHTLESDVPLPVTKDALIAEIDVQPTLLGKLWTALYKPPELRISVTLTGGQARNFRLVPGMAKAGFILSPLITDTNEFVLLTAASRDNLARNVVKSFSISAVAGKSLFWQDTYSVRLAEFK
jgi:hypothetical protein